MIRHLMLLIPLMGAISAQKIYAEKIKFGFSEEHLEKASVTYGVHDAERNNWHLYSGVLLHAGHSFVEIPATTDRFKAVVWTPGCKVKQFDVRVEKADIELQFGCEPLANVTFFGRVKGVDVAGTKISVSYGGTKTCGWIGEDQTDSLRFIHCMGYQIVGIATAAVTPDGTFKLELPDFGGDPIISDDSSSELVFGISGLKGVWLLQPVPAKGISTKTMSIRVAPSYPGEVTFLAVPFDDFPAKMQ